MAALAFATWWYLRADDSLSTPSAPLPGTPFPTVFPVEAATSVSPAASAASSVAEVERPGAQTEIQICGGRWLKLEPDGQPNEAAAAETFMRAMDEIGSMALASMTSSGSPQSQAAAQYFRVGRADVAGRARADCDTATCVGFTERWQTEGEGQRDALARLAQDAGDPQIYAWAYRTCQSAGRSPQGPCLSISAAQWVHLDPGNADPWLAVAAEARLRKDAAAFDDAMFHVANAERHDPGWGSLTAQLIDHVPPDDANLLGLMGLMTQAAGIDSLSLPAWGPASQYCSEKELADANRRETCGRMATMLAERSTTLIARSVGDSFGKRVGWSTERIEAATRLRDAERAVMDRRAGRTLVEPMACGNLRTEVDWMRNVARWGEVEAYRREVAAAGIPISELAAEARRGYAETAARVAREEAAASGAASGAASTASGPTR
jgi:hypothetical protein